VKGSRAGYGLSSSLSFWWRSWWAMVKVIQSSQSDRSSHFTSQAEAEAEAESRSMRRYHIEMLVVAAIAVACALLLEVQSDRQVGLRYGPNVTLPPTCVSRDWFDVPCPGCGLTRSFIELAQGHFANSWHHNRLGWVLALATLFQFPYRWYALRYPDAKLLSRNVTKWIGTSLIVLLIGNWLFNLLADRW